eukprot:gnl/TRDRNA2_/TRDRNA2_36662_c0_seq1.p1 gnl/TRDRNA2_/TRDRNA2_36662_c0~~gnl/TRDRNA2_/TRDRNA2_36662_c0_seq1.p1  ORF type:complete len:336 (+),score=38.02 gnl/TRDRNA2_/TRDRNA2_36662_c0_seq1:128-1009(+)
MSGQIKAGNDKNTSYGVFVSVSATHDFSLEDNKKLYFSTNSREALPWRESVYTENYDEIHNMGKKKDGKYMKFQLNTAPLVDRSACKYTRDYPARPLGDHICNHGLAKTFRGPPVQKTPGITFGKSSCYTDTFVRYEPDRMKQAQQPNCKPPRGLTNTLPSGESTEMQTHAEMNYTCPPKEFTARGGKVKPPQGNLTLAGSIAGGAYTSMYNLDFGEAGKKNKEKKKQLSVAELYFHPEREKEMKKMRLSRSASQPAPSAAEVRGYSDGAPGVHKLEDEVYATKRCVHISPGK